MASEHVDGAAAHELRKTPSEHETTDTVSLTLPVRLDAVLRRTVWHRPCSTFPRIVREAVGARTLGEHRMRLEYASGGKRLALGVWGAGARSSTTGRR